MSGKDVAEFIRMRDAKLDPARLAIKYAAMRQNPFAFFRATCALFYERLPKMGRLMHAPLAWSCGDLHVENFGTFRARNGLVYFDINDFDEAMLAPCSFDILRATASIAMAGRSLRLSGSREDALVRRYVAAYARALCKGEIGWIERDNAGGPIGTLMSNLRGRSHEQLLDKRTVRTGKDRKILVDGKKALEAPDSEKARVARLIENWARKNTEDGDPAENFYEVVDVALRIAGLGSMGGERYVVLVKGKGAPNQMRLLDLKRTRAASGVQACPNRQPKWASEAERIYVIEKRMQAKIPANLAVIVDRSRSYVLRELQPHEDRLDLSVVSSVPDGLENAMMGFGKLTAWAQLRSAGRHGSALCDDLSHFAEKDKWQERIMEAAKHCAARAQDDWALFCVAYDKNAFTSSSSAAP